MKVVVLAGGTSTERDVSLCSGAMVANALQDIGYETALVDVFLGVPQKTDLLSMFSTSKKHSYTVSSEEPDIEGLKRSRGTSRFGQVGENVIELCRMADIVYMGLHGDAGEDGRMQAFFDMLEIKYTGSGSLGSALAMHKGITKQLFFQNNIPTPKSICLKRGQTPSVDFFPCVVKPCSGGSSIGVVLAHNEAELQEAVDRVFSYEEELLLEQYISGREFSVGVLGSEALPPIEIIPDGVFYDYVHKYQAGLAKEICPAHISSALEQKMQQSALEVFHTLQLSVYGRIDYMVDEYENIYCLEANTLPGMTPTSLLPQEAKAIGIEYGDLCRRIIELSLEKYRG